MQTQIKNIPFGRPMIGEEERSAVQEVLSNPVLAHGPKSKDFEASFAEFTKAPYAVSVSSCAAALHLAYLGLGLKSGDEVLVPAQTHVATAHAAELCGAKAVFVDAESATGNIDIAQLENRISPKTRAIAVVHFLGMPVSMEPVVCLAKKHGLFVVEDCALALGATYQNIHVGLLGDAGCFSFYPVKHMTTGEGGMLITRHEELFQKVSRLKAFGMDRSHGERSVPGQYDVTMLGLNYRMNEIQAALGIEQLKKVPRFLSVRRENADCLRRKLEGISEISLFKNPGPEFQSSEYCLSVILSDSLAPKRGEIIQYLNSAGVGTSIYYPHPVPLLTYYREKYHAQTGIFPVAEKISYHSIALPVGPHLNTEDMRVIAQTFKDAIRETCE